MIPKYLSLIWAAIAPAMQSFVAVDHIAVAAGLLSLTLRKNHARARHWLWLVASVKFLIPAFSVLSAWGHPGLCHAVPQAGCALQ
jgi:hypothetical protein